VRQQPERGAAERGDLRHRALQPAAHERVREQREQDHVQQVEITEGHAPIL
jgi:hypothetical protein